jgi:drug/metabolite transporter, DME family
LNAAPPLSPASKHRATAVVSTICGLVAAAGYTAANSCLRSVTHCDPVWVSTIKAFPVMVLVGPWLIVQYARGEKILPTARVLGLLAFASLVGQLAGNVLFQWALGVVGLALTAPLTLATIILAGALMGRFFLHEPLTPRTGVSVLVLIVAISVLSLGAQEAHRLMARTGGAGHDSEDWRLMAAGVAAATLSGIAYAVLGVVIRYGVSGRASMTLTMFTVGVTGTIGLGGLTVGRMGIAGMLDTTTADMGMMVLAGLFNAGAFLALTKSLQLTDLVRVNALNATQAALSAIAGVVLFHEPRSAALAVGVVLTVVGLLIMRQRKPAP